MFSSDRRFVWADQGLDDIFDLAMISTSVFLKIHFFYSWLQLNANIKLEVYVSYLDKTNNILLSV